VGGLDARVARVRYIDDSEYATPCPDQMPHGLESAYCKPLVYRHEREVRATLIPFQPEERRENERDLCRGFPIRVDLPTLVEGVVVSERFPQFAVPVVKEALSRAGVSIRARLSAINRGPLGQLLDPP
jgi:hypothetical protein